jgi:hypothetical protein
VRWHLQELHPYIPQDRVLEQVAGMSSSRLQECPRSSSRARANSRIRAATNSWETYRKTPFRAWHIELHHPQQIRHIAPSQEALKCSLLGTYIAPFVVTVLERIVRPRLALRIPSSGTVRTSGRTTSRFRPILDPNRALNSSKQYNVYEMVFTSL